MPVTNELVTSIVSITLSSDVFLMVILPLSASTFSLKLRTIVELRATSVVLSGTEELNVGTALAVVKLNAVVELIPAYEPLSVSSNAVASIKT